MPFFFLVCCNEDLCFLTNLNGFHVDSSGAMTWSYQPLVGSLSYQNIVYMHDPISDPISEDGNITIGFGLRSFKEHGEDYWSVFYMKDNEHGKGSIL